MTKILFILGLAVLPLTSFSGSECGPNQSPQAFCSVRSSALSISERIEKNRISLVQCAYNNNQLTDRRLAMGLSAAFRLRRWQNNYLGFMRNMMFQANALGVTPEELSRSRCANDTIVSEAVGEKSGGCSARWTALKNELSYARMRVGSSRAEEIRRLTDFILPESNSCLSDSEVALGTTILRNIPKETPHTTSSKTNASSHLSPRIAQLSDTVAELTEVLEPSNQAATYRTVASEIETLAAGVTCPADNLRDIYRDARRKVFQKDDLVVSEDVRAPFGLLDTLSETTSEVDCRRFVNLLGHIQTTLGNLGQAYALSDSRARQEAMHDAAETSGEMLSNIFQSEGKSAFLARINTTCNEIKEELSDLVCTNNPAELLVSTYDGRHRAGRAESSEERNKDYIENLYRAFLPERCSSPVDSGAGNYLSRVLDNTNEEDSTFSSETAGVNSYFCKPYLEWQQNCKAGECASGNIADCNIDASVDDYCASSDSSKEAQERAVSLCELRRRAPTTVAPTSQALARSGSAYRGWVDNLSQIGSMSSGRASFVPVASGATRNTGGVTSAFTPSVTTLASASGSTNSNSGTISPSSAITPAAAARVPSILSVPSAGDDGVRSPVSESAVSENEREVLSGDSAGEDAAATALRDRIARLEAQIAAAEATATSASGGRAPASVNEDEEDVETDLSAENAEVAPVASRVAPTSERSGREARVASLQSGNDSDDSVIAPNSISPQVAAVAPPLGFDLGNTISENAPSISSYNNSRNAVLGLPRLSLNVAGVSVLTEAGSSENLVSIEAPPASVQDVSGVTDYIKSKVDPALVRNGPVIIQLGTAGSLWKVSLGATGDLEVTPVPKTQVAQVQRVFLNNLRSLLAQAQSSN